MRKGVKASKRKGKKGQKKGRIILAFTRALLFQSNHLQLKF